MASNNIARELAELIQSENALNSDEIVQAKLDLAERVAEYWKQLAQEHKDTGEYIDSIDVVQDGNTVAVVATSDIAHLLEFGTVDTPELAFRARTESYFNSKG